MKEKIYEKYGYKIDYLTYKNGNISFELNGIIYLLLKTDLSNDRLEQINFIVNYLDGYAIFFHQLVRSNDGFILEFGKDKYVLIKPRIISNREITVEEIIKLSNISIGIYSNNLIEEKIDFIEKYLSNYEKLDLVNINYFIGLSENSISLFNLIGNNNRNYINHKRIFYKEKAIDFYNPLNLVLDYKTRDLAEYTKSAFIAGENQVIENMRLLNKEDYLPYFARVMFPSFYFDAVDKYINLGIKMDKKRISELANSFESVLKKTYDFIISNVNIPYIEWLSNINNF